MDNVGGIRVLLIHIYVDKADIIKKIWRFLAVSRFTFRNITGDKIITQGSMGAPQDA